MKRGVIESISIATSLILLNIILIWVFAFTPLAAINNALFRYFIVGVLVYGALLTGGLYLARKGVEDGHTTTAILGLSLIQLAYGTFGAGLISMLSVEAQFTALLITGAISVLIALAAYVVVYATGHDFSQWGRYANYLFLGVIGASVLGTLIPALTLLAFLLALAGFITYLVHQVYVTKTRPNQSFLNAIGLYTAFMGVFVEILKFVVRAIGRE